MASDTPQNSNQAMIRMGKRLKNKQEQKYEYLISCISGAPLINMIKFVSPHESVTTSIIKCAIPYFIHSLT